MDFWILLLCHFHVLLFVTSVRTKGAGKGKCDHLQGVSLKLICNNRVSDEIFLRYGDYRARPNTPYSVWQTEGPANDKDMIILVSFHDDFLHTYSTMVVDSYNPAETSHTFSMKSPKGSKTYIIQPSLLYCIPVSLRYPMELRSHCLGQGRSSEVSGRPVLHYAMDDLGHDNDDDSASSLNPCEILMIVAVFCVFFGENRIQI